MEPKRVGGVQKQGREANTGSYFAGSGQALMCVAVEAVQDWFGQLDDQRPRMAFGGGALSGGGAINSPGVTGFPWHGPGEEYM